MFDFDYLLAAFWLTMLVLIIAPLAITERMSLHSPLPQERRNNV